MRRWKRRGGGCARSAGMLNNWTKLKLEQVAKGRCWCENPTCKGRGGGLEAHHAIFGQKKGKHARPEYDVVENMVLLCHRCHEEKAVGREWSLHFLARLHGKVAMRNWLESLKATHKDTTDIDYFLRCLDDA